MGICANKLTPWYELIGRDPITPCHSNPYPPWPWTMDGLPSAVGAAQVHLAGILYLTSGPTAICHTGRSRGPAVPALPASTSGSISARWRLACDCERQACDRSAHQGVTCRASKGQKYGADLRGSDVVIVARAANAMVCARATSSQARHTGVALTTIKVGTAAAGDEPEEAALCSRSRAA
jgi:hypothetical protein